MDIAALSMSMSQSKLQTSVSVSVLKKAMNSQETQAQALIESLEAAAPAPSAQPYGKLLDIRA